MALNYHSIPMDCPHHSDLGLEAFEKEVRELFEDFEVCSMFGLLISLIRSPQEYTPIHSSIWVIPDNGQRHKLNLSSTQ